MKRIDHSGIIGKFGGYARLAEALDLPLTTVNHWTKTGQIPVHRFCAVMQAAADRAIVLEPADFVAVREE